jgi:hypothetical protein
VSKTVLELTLNRPNSDYSSRNEYAMFKVFMPAAAEDLFVSVTCLSGDADVYISTDADPSQEEGHFMWEQKRWGSDAITIYPEDAKYCR